MTKIDRPTNSSDVSSGEAGGVPAPADLVRRYRSAVLGVCLANTKSVHDAEDVMQDVFTKAFTRLSTLREPTRVRAWLMQIARRACVDHYRKRPRTRQICDDVPARSEGDEERISRLHAAVSKLPADYRETISLYYLDGRKCTSVAESLGISEQAVRQRLVRARLMLHDLLVEGQS